MAHYEPFLAVLAVRFLEACIDCGEAALRTRVTEADLYARVMCALAADGGRDRALCAAVLELLERLVQVGGITIVSSSFPRWKTKLNMSALSFEIGGLQCGLSVRLCCRSLRKLMATGFIAHNLCCEGMMSSDLLGPTSEIRASLWKIRQVGLAELECPKNEGVESMISRRARHLKILVEFQEPSAAPLTRNGKFVEECLFWRVERAPCALLPSVTLNCFPSVCRRIWRMTFGFFGPNILPSSLCSHERTPLTSCRQSWTCYGVPECRPNETESCHGPAGNVRCQHRRSVDN